MPGFFVKKLIAVTAAQIWRNISNGLIVTGAIRIFLNKLFQICGRIHAAPRHRGAQHSSTLNRIKDAIQHGSNAAGKQQEQRALPRCLEQINFEI